MDLYLTPGQFRNLNLGVDVKGWIDAELAPILARASEDANAFCNAPSVPVPHSFLGGSIVGETHVWRTDPYQNRPTRRLFPYHTPVIAISQMRLYATLTQYLDFSASELHYEASEGWVEPASANLTSYGLFGSAVLPWVGLTEPFAQLSYTYGRRIPETVRLWYQGNGGTTWRAQYGFWTSDAIEVRVDDVVVTTGFTIDRFEGTITWTTNVPSGSARVEADVVSRAPSTLGTAVGLIAADRISSRGLVADGFPEGIRSLRVAEFAIDRNMPRQSMATQNNTTIPDKAAELLSDFMFRPMAWV
ncbi:MAG TPA: hypothetical protein VFP22_02180 [Candidatus Limnocylindrales bacterium]|nr:hypothetical protein [Candidatus Limnocylindrales bacterium]